jgi:hypothetical protein
MPSGFYRHTRREVSAGPQASAGPLAPYCSWVIGTTGRGAAAHVTAGELCAAAEHNPHTALYVLFEIRLQRDWGKPRADGGVIRVVTPWLRGMQLEPFAFGLSRGDADE